MSRNNKATTVRSLPTVMEAFNEYTTLGGILTEPHPFGKDPLENSPAFKQIRQDLFKERLPSLEPVFSSIVTGDNSKFKEGLSFYIALTKRLGSCV